MTAIAVIDVSGLTKRFDGRAVVDGISLSVGAGEVMGFLGPNGSGKTTMIRMMCGLLTPDGGEGRVLGHDIRREGRAIKRDVGYMTQRFSFYEDLTIQENLSFVAGLYTLDDPAAVVAATVADLGLTARRHQLSGTLSGGWKQRLALAACTMHRPRLLMLDEPTAGVDPKARREFWDEIHRLAASGMTVLVSTHYMDEAERCDRIAYISNGHLITQGTVDDVVARAGLTTLVARGADLVATAKALRAEPAVDQVAAYGTALHVIGRDGPALRAAAARVGQATGATFAEAATGLEDVFIQLMTETAGAS